MDLFFSQVRPSFNVVLKHPHNLRIGFIGLSCWSILYPKDSTVGSVVPLCKIPHNGPSVSPSSSVSSVLGIPEINLEDFRGMDTSVQEKIIMLSMETLGWGLPSPPYRELLYMRKEYVLGTFGVTALSAFTGMVIVGLVWTSDVTFRGSWITSESGLKPTGQSPSIFIFHLHSYEDDQKCSSDQSKHRYRKIKLLHVYPMTSLYPMKSRVLKSKYPSLGYLCIIGLYRGVAFLSFTPFQIFGCVRLASLGRP